MFSMNFEQCQTNHDKNDFCTKMTKTALELTALIALIKLDSMLFFKPALIKLNWCLMCPCLFLVNTKC